MKHGDGYGNKDTELKFTANKLVTKTLRKAGWRVLRIWEHQRGSAIGQGKLECVAGRQLTLNTRAKAQPRVGKVESVAGRQPERSGANEGRLRALLRRALGGGWFTEAREGNEGFTAERREWNKQRGFESPAAFGH